MIDDADIHVIDAMQNIAKALADKHHWSLKQRGKLKTAMGLLMQATDQLDNIEIGPEVAPIWEKVNKS